MVDDVKVQDLTDYTQQARPRRSRMQSLVWIHRIGPTCGQNVSAIARFFISGEGAQYTGGTMAYHYVVLPDLVQQALPLEEQGAHARRWGNAHGVGVAILGDFRTERPPRSQWLMALALCADLVPILRPHSYEVRDLLPNHLRYGVPVVGHGEVKGAYSKASDKTQPHGRNACPGQHWDMRAFRGEVEREVLRRAALRLSGLGHRLTR